MRKLRSKHCALKNSTFAASLCSFCSLQMIVLRSVFFGDSLLNGDGQTDCKTTSCSRRALLRPRCRPKPPTPSHNCAETSQTSNCRCGSSAADAEQTRSRCHAGPQLQQSLLAAVQSGRSRLVSRACWATSSARSRTAAESSTRLSNTFMRGVDPVLNVHQLVEELRRQRSRSPTIRDGSTAAAAAMLTRPRSAAAAASASETAAKSA